MTTQTIDMSQRFYNRPLMISDDEVEHLTMVGPKGMTIEDMSAQVNAMWSAVARGERKPYEVKGSVAIIPVNGTLYHKVAWASSYYTGYDWLNNMMDFAASDPEVKGVAFDFNTGGGEVSGAFECAENLFKLGQIKPTLALVNDRAYSAGYLLTSAATKVNVSPTGGTGSIGVVTSHMDMSEAMSDAGYKLTFIFKGKHKVDGNMYQPLSEAVRKRIDAKLETPYNLFVDAVVKYRKMDAQAIRDTEAMTYTAEESLSMGLVDTVQSSEQALAAFVADLNGKNWSTEMSKAEEQATTNADKGNETVITQQTVDAARNEGVDQGIKAERERIMGIMKCEEAKGREKLAEVLCDQGMSVEAAKAVLAASPVANQSSQADRTDHFANAMNNTQNPEVGADNQTNQADQQPWQTALQNYALATGADASKLIN